MIYGTTTRLEPILQAASKLRQAELLELITHLARQAQEAATAQEKYYWRDIAGIAPNLLHGQDAQEWIVDDNRLTAVTSPITLAECVYYPYRLSDKNLIGEFN